MSLGGKGENVPFEVDHLVQALPVADGVVPDRGARLLPVRILRALRTCAKEKE